jgi:excisionase family DNA binding protein
MQLITRVEAAKLLGVTKEAVYQAIKRGRIPTHPDKKGTPMLDADTLVKDWNKNTQRPVSVKTPDKPPEQRKPEPRMSRTQEYIPDYDESRARTEHLKAELLEIDRQQKQGKLVAAVDVESKWLEIVTMARSKMLGIPSKAKQRIPDLDANAMKALEDIVRETLEDLSEGPRDE